VSLAVLELARMGSLPVRRDGIFVDPTVAVIAGEGPIFWGDSEQKLFA
jgi:hypothetical protein